MLARFLPLLFTLVAWSSSAEIAAAERPLIPPGARAPDVAFTDVSGGRQKLADYRGKVVVLEFLNPACPYVVRHYRSGNLPELQRQAAADGVVWLQVNSMAMGDLDAKASADWQKKNNVTAT